MNNDKKSLNWECPLPELDFDVITLGHGSGGLLTNKLLDSGVFDLLSNEYLDRRHDGAFLPGGLAFTTDSFVVSPIFFPGGNIGELAINGTVNDLAMCGAIPKYLSLSFILEEGLPVAQFWEVLVSIRKACAMADVMVVTGDTKVVERGKGDQIFVNTTGIGQVHSKAQIDPGRVAAGDKLLVSGNLAAHGIAILSVREGLAFESDILSDTRPLNGVVERVLDRFGEGIKLFRDPTRGGVATALNEIARDTRLGVEIRQRDLPLDDQVNSACEILGLDPLYVANEGIFLAWVDAAIADECLAFLRETEEGSQAACIGEMVAAHPGKVIMQSSIGGRRVVNMLPGEQLPRIC
ncbi:MAG: hydrogenase expression/formation protein HypE [Saprospirales bacterium]|nr:hydrogenase expression/formation protein HypE [Saprospirales bacterium]MBK8491021.1 hydrogenase expression/formation protein HypE [Saprospirales bacterium]